MNESTPLASPDPSRNSPAPGDLPRLRFPTICVVVFWLLSFVVGMINKPYFVGFMYGLGSTGLLTLLILGWWWFNRGLRRWEKWAGFALIIGEAWLVGKGSHRSITGFTLWMGGFPLIASAVVAWFFIAKRFRLSWARMGFAIVVSLVWAHFLFIRVDGPDSSLKAKSHWRWTPTAEEQFLAAGKPGSLAPGLPDRAAAEITSPAANDWIAFRGTDRDGVVVGNATTTNWTAAPPSLVWKCAVGPAWSSLLVVGDSIYTQEQRGEKETVVCYDASTGAQVWVHEDLARFEEAVSGPGPRATPTFAGGRLYTQGGTGVLNCLDAKTGRVIWRRDLREDSGAKLPMWAFSSSPLVASDLVIAYAGGEAGKGLLAYKVQSGEVAWTAAAGASSYSSPQLTSLAGVPQVLMLHDGGLTSVDPASGKKLWETGVAMKGAPRCGQPRLIDGNKLLVAALGGLGCSLIEVSTNGGQWTVTNKWDSKDLKPEFPDFVVFHGYAYGFDVGIFCCLNLADGKRVWKEGRYGRGQVMLLRDQGLLLVSSESGELVLLAADPAAHRELGRFQALSSKTWNHPVVRGDRVYLRSAEEMACYSFSTKPATALN